YDQRTAGDPRAAARPEPAIAILGEERTRWRAVAPRELHGRARRIIAGHDRDRVAYHGRAAARAGGRSADERVSEQPQRPAVDQVDGVGPVTAKPSRFLVKQRVLPGHSRAAPGQ